MSRWTEPPRLARAPGRCTRTPPPARGSADSRVVYEIAAQTCCISFAPLVASRMDRFHRYKGGIVQRVFAGLVHAPDGSGAKLSALVVCHAGDLDTAAGELAPLLSFGSPVMTQVGPMPYPQMNTLLDAGYPTGALNYWLSSFTRGLPDALIDTAVERFASVPSTMTAILFFYGAVTRVSPTDTAVPHREPGWNLLIPSVWTDPAATEANIRWTRETHAALAPHLAARRWLNYLGDDQGDDAVQAAYGPNYDRLRDIKGAPVGLGVKVIEGG